MESTRALLPLRLLLDLPEASSSRCAPRPGGQAAPAAAAAAAAPTAADIDIDIDVDVDVDIEM